MATVAYRLSPALQKSMRAAEKQEATRKARRAGFDFGILFLAGDYFMKWHSGHADKFALAFLMVVVLWQAIWWMDRRINRVEGPKEMVGVYTSPSEAEAYA